MSTLAAAAAPGDPVPWVLLWSLFGALALISTGLTVAAYFLGAFRGSVQGSPRVEPGRSAWPVAIGLAAALLGLFMGGSVGYLTLGLDTRRAVVQDAVTPPSDVLQEHERANPEQLVKLMQVSAISYFAATGAALLTIIVAHLAGWRGGIGLGISRLGRGLLVGAAALLLIIPWMMTSAIGLQIVRKALGYPLDAAHELIRAIRESPEPNLIFWGFVSAVVVAPLAEEILFRGFLQTSLVHAWSWLLDRRDPGGAAFQIVAPGQPDAPTPGIPPEAEPRSPLLTATPMLGYAHPAPPRPPPRRYPPSAVARWTAIAITSVVFALLHEAWSIPLIFLLSLGLGYIYERSGSLWACILVHFGFNGLNMLFLLPVILGSAG